jgi:two-component system response regulator DegU
VRTPAFLVKEKLGVKMPQVTGKHVRVLAVDDSPAFLNTLCTFLEDDPTYEIVATAQNGEEALSAVERWHPQVVLMDLQMPKMNGLEATVELHQHYPELTVIILTAHDLPTLRDACIQHGAYGFVTKAQLGRQLPALLANAPVPQDD